MATEIRMPQFGVSMETGTVAQWLKAEGDTVKAGDVLVILEAMKMENEIMAPCDGTVTSVSVTKGAAVESGALLCTIG